MYGILRTITYLKKQKNEELNMPKLKRACKLIMASTLDAWLPELTQSMCNWGVSKEKKHINYEPGHNLCMAQQLLYNVIYIYV